MTPPTRLPAHSSHTVVTRPGLPPPSPLTVCEGVPGDERAGDGTDLMVPQLPWICPPSRDAAHGETLLAWDNGSTGLALATRPVLDAVARLHS